MNPNSIDFSNNLCLSFFTERLGIAVNVNLYAYVAVVIHICNFREHNGMLFNSLKKYIFSTTPLIIWCSIVFFDCGFHSVCRMMDKDKRLMEAS